MKVKQFILGPIYTNCYVVVNGKKKGVIIDPGKNPESVIEYIEHENISVEGIFITHVHYDHIAGVDYIRSYFKKKNLDISVYVPKKELLWAKDSEYNGSAYNNENIIISGYLKTYEDVSNILDEKFELITFRGHSICGTAIYFPKHNKIFSGDVLFYEGIGRDDFLTSMRQYTISDIKEKLLVLPENTEVYCGHGYKTTIAHEKNNNIYLR